VLPFQRGAWIRLYGIPLHAWNERLFKLCVFNCGRYLRADNCSLNRERFDYARVLISTSSLDVENISDQILVDGMMVEIKIIEEWGFNLGDDACLYDEDDKSVSESQVNADIHKDFEINNNVEILADKIVHDLVEADDLKGVDMNENDKATTKNTNSIEVLANLHLNGCSDSPVGVKKTSDVHKMSVEPVKLDGSAMGNDKCAPIVSDKQDEVSAVGVIVPSVAVHFTSDGVGSSRKRRNK